MGSTEPEGEVLMSMVNPKEIGTHVGSNTTQANSIHARGLADYRKTPNQTDVVPRATKAEVDREFKAIRIDEDNPDIDLGSIQKYYVNIKKPLVIDGDISLWDANVIIDEMEKSRDLVVDMGSTKDLVDKVNSSNVWEELAIDATDATDEEVLDYIEVYIRNKNKPELYEDSLNDLADALDMDGVDVGYFDELIENVISETNSSKDPSVFLKSIKKALGRDLNEKEWDKLAEIKSQELDEVLNDKLFGAEYDSLDFSTKLEKAAQTHKTGKAFRKFLQDLGFDGIDYRNVGEASGLGDSARSYIVFEPTQIKSFTAEAFDAADPRVQKASGGLISRSARRHNRELLYT